MKFGLSTDVESTSFDHHCRVRNNNGAYKM